MKKLFGIALLSVFVLAACGGGSDSDDRTIVCTIEEAGVEGTITAEVEGGDVVEITIEVLGMTTTFSEDELQDSGINDFSAEGFISDIEAEGGECSY